MEKFDIPPPVKLVCGVLYHTVAPVEACLLALVERFGEMDFRSAPLPFEYTDYYFEEMGRPLLRIFVSFQRLIDSAGLPEIKLAAAELESAYAEAGKRRINIDPGYVNAAAYILSTSKNYAHRIHLRKGVFAQQEILFERKKLRTLDWTYPDYRSYEYQDILRKIRQIYLQQVRVFEENRD